MARYQFNDDTAPADMTDRATTIMQSAVRGFGILLLLVGLFITLKVVFEAWALYRDPGRIEAFAVAIEKGSNLDRALMPVRDEVDANQSGAAADAASGAPRVSYFVAWVLALLLLMLVGRLALGAVRVGGELALYDMYVKKFVRELVRQSAGGSSG
ncbi:MAG: hypothetical protein HKO62_11855 [Gammaproteobacteria bacterium]|nr:hypothetical protein [Gammaproteobacteria bacterium]